jgi:hypothetical protein
MKQFRFIVFALFAAMTLAFGLVVAQQQENEEAIEDRIRQYEERFNAGDAAGVAELFTLRRGCHTL